MINLFSKSKKKQRTKNSRLKDRILDGTITTIFTIPSRSQWELHQSYRKLFFNFKSELL